jgi:hypothetical protein
MLKISTFLIILISVFATKKVIAQKIELDTDSKKLDHTKYQYFDINDHEQRTLFKLRVVPDFGATLILDDGSWSRLFTSDRLFNMYGVEQKIFPKWSIGLDYYSGTDLNRFGLYTRYYRLLNQVNNFSGKYIEIGIENSWLKQNTDLISLYDQSSLEYKIALGIQSKRGKFGLIDYGFEIRVDPYSYISLRTRTNVDLAWGITKYLDKKSELPKQVNGSFKSLLLSGRLPHVQLSKYSRYISTSFGLEYMVYKSLSLRAAVLGSHEYSGSNDKVYESKFFRINFIPSIRYYIKIGNQESIKNEAFTGVYLDYSYLHLPIFRNGYYKLDNEVYEINHFRLASHKLSLGYREKVSDRLLGHLAFGATFQPENSLRDLSGRAGGASSLKFEINSGISLIIN